MAGRSPLVEEEEATGAAAAPAPSASTPRAGCRATLRRRRCWLASVSLAVFGVVVMVTAQVVFTGGTGPSHLTSPHDPRCDASTFLRCVARRL